MWLSRVVQEQHGSSRSPVVCRQHGSSRSQSLTHGIGLALQFMHMPQVVRCGGGGRRLSQQVANCGRPIWVMYCNVDLPTTPTLPYMTRSAQPCGPQAAQLGHASMQEGLVGQSCYDATCHIDTQPQGHTACPRAAMQRMIDHPERGGGG